MTTMHYVSQAASHPVTQQLHDRAATLRAELREFRSTSWPYLGQGYALLSSLTDGVDSTLGMLCDELERDRVGMAILANPTTPHVDPAWMAEVRKRADSSATKLPQVASLLCQLEPQGKELRKLCIELIERAPRLPLPILAAAKTAAAALDRWLEHGPLTEEVARLHRELQDVGSISEMVGARAIAKQIKAAAQALGE